MNISRPILSLLISMGLGIMSANAEHCDQCCVCAKKVCQVTVDREEVEKTCFDCKCEDICIPPVRFWWECGPLKKCGKIRTVRKLVPEKFTTTVCTYDWNVISICTGCYRHVHRLRCDEMGVAYETPAERLGLPVPLPNDDAQEHLSIKIPRSPSQSTLRGTAAMTISGSDRNSRPRRDSPWHQHNRAMTVVPFGKGRMKHATGNRWNCNLRRNRFRYLEPARPIGCAGIRS